MTKTLKPSSTNSRSRAASLRRQAKVGGYLAASVGASVLGTAPSEAAIIDIDLGPSPGFNILGLNGGVAPGGQRDIANFPVAGGMNLELNNGSYSHIGVFGFMSVGGDNVAAFAAGSGFLTPTNFAKDSIIDSSVDFSFYSGFSYAGNVSPNFGPGSYMGFRFPNGSDFNYGWLEVTWDGATSEFQILSGAYESVPGVGILAGAVAVPEPSTVALTGIAALALGAGAIRRSRKARSAAEDSSAATAI